ncbi:MAG: DNA-directed RNA polymerase subunit K [Nanoarchaeota archaeon]|nr:DNA-directed RNA polymerase subunit K [Nanoarchaeota archaeon]
MTTEIFTKYETARILGARALQLAMDAPLLVKIKPEELEHIKYDPLKIAEIEFTSGVLPITVKRPMPQKVEKKLKKEVVKEKNIENGEDDKKVEDMEKKEEDKIKDEGEIMELAKPEDEIEEEDDGDGGEE